MAFVCILLSVLLLLSPMSAYAAELSDPVEPVPTFYGYEIHGYDNEGNVILSNDDYIEYFNARLSSNVAVMSLFGDVAEETTRFITEKAWNAIQNSIGYKLLFGDNLALDVKAPGNNNPEPQKEVTIDKKVISYGKKTITYTKANAVETITLGAYVNFDTPDVSRITIARSGFGASSTFYLTPVEGGTGGISWASSYYSIGGTWTAYSNGSASGSGVRQIRMYGYSVNSLPNSDTTSSTLISNTNAIIVGSNSTHADYAENTFQTNDYEYNANHTIIYNTNNYWQPMNFLAPIIAGNTINANNINNFNVYGYYLNPEGYISFDPDVFFDYFNNTLMPELELLYKNNYQEFPEPGATYGDTDIVYDNPFDDDSETNLPDTVPGGGGTVIVEGGMTPSELYGVLETEEYYILDMETGLPAMQIDSLPEVEVLPAEIVSAASGVSNFVIDLLSQTGLLTIFMALVVLAFVVFAFHG